jgi:hypothetical protein
MIIYVDINSENGMLILGIHYLNEMLINGIMVELNIVIISGRSNTLKWNYPIIVDGTNCIYCFIAINCLYHISFDGSMSMMGNSHQTCNCPYHPYKHLEYHHIVIK